MGFAMIETFATEKEAEAEKLKLLEIGDYRKGDLVIFYEPKFLGKIKPWSLNMR